MTVYTVRAVDESRREWSSSRGGKFYSYKVDLQEEGGPVHLGVEWAKKTTSPPPSEDERVAGHIEPRDDFPDRFKIDYEATKELSHGNRPSAASSPRSGTSKGNWQPESERDPERAARILRQHSQSCALAAIKLHVDHGELTGSYVDENALKADIRKWTEWFDQDVQKAGQAATSAQGADESRGAGSLPSPSVSPESSSQSAPSEAVHDVEMALAEPPSGQFLSAQGRTVVANYMLSELPPEELKRACNQLVNGADQSQQDSTLRAMKLRAERWTGKPLPEGGSPSAPEEDDIPFARPEYREPFSERMRWRF